MDGYRLLLCLRHHLGLLLQSTDNAVHGVQEVLLAHLLAVMTGSYQGSLVTNIGNVGTRESRCLTSQEVNVQVLVQLQRLQVYHEYFTALVQVGQVHVYLSVKAACTHQC